MEITYASTSTQLQIKRGTTKLASIVQLPDEIIVEILSRVPVKALLRFKCVCKFWKDLISKPDFFLSSTGRERAIVGFLPYSKRRYVDSRHMYFYSIDDKFSVEELPGPVGEVPSDYSSFTVFGTCNGLILFATVQGMYLWNPLTRCCRLLTQLKVLEYMYPPRTLIFTASGLCFDKSSDDYKAVLVGFEGGCTRGYSQSVYVASLRTGELLLKDRNFPYTVCRKDIPNISSTSGVLLNNHLHWIMGREPDFVQLLICFDEEMNRFTELPMPDKHEQFSYFGTQCFMWMPSHV
ncbi:OLC1v1000737C1 [Oldenlandia corymbosa var. corymbosa]|uniref:OLC1v1000737C1 n=1 Tax=Oldenlandia corymbosa var. corymbosa TaxID=529605 RepID=A0AAV1D3G2_OLDCO|nr:OLC1v1000737C1 [Oldenlandia corymbosa var. corymbosa]